MTQLSKCFRFDLTDSFAGYAEFTTYFFKSAKSAVFKTKSQDDNLAFAFC